MTQPTERIIDGGLSGTPKRSARQSPIVVGIAVLLGVVVLTGLADTALDRDQLERTTTELGSWGPIIFVILMTLFLAIGVPGIVFVLSASTLWPAPIAAGAVIIGGMTGSSVRFFFARSMGRNWVEARLPPRLRRWDERLSAGGIRTVIVLRLIFNLAAPPDWILGLSRITTRQFLVGTVIGRTPVAVAWIVAGGSLLRLVARAPIVACAAVPLIAATLFAFRFGRGDARRCPAKWVPSFRWSTKGRLRSQVSRWTKRQHTPANRRPQR